jgi:hypothetical protein
MAETARSNAEQTAVSISQESVGRPGRGAKRPIPAILATRQFEKIVGGWQPKATDPNEKVADLTSGLRGPQTGFEEVWPD